MATFRFTEKFLVVFSAIGLFLKFFSGEGGGLFLLLSLSLLGVLYLLFAGFYFRVERFRFSRSVFPGLSGFFFALGCVGLLFKFMYWPGGNLLLLIAILGACGVMTYCTYQRNRTAEEEKGRYYKALIDRGMIIALLCSIIFSIPDATLIRFEYRKDPHLAELMIAFLKDPDNEEKLRAVHEYRLHSLMEDPPHNINTP